ncbi:GNAT family N-acetyltransferase [Streptomyces aidingensis]|uniref:Predicted acetyltransferase n=1 Tax=Streptomyces aidingensis TaxID=910347 RepID=A0A1I1FKN7_9ACTN|nr:GNAT family N-acetyltransferase [Streptomyces aidingensis]SFB97630.1 Predicted acetyltransferase [Streptomyces aidingensis]
MTSELRVPDPADWNEWYATLETAFGGITEAPEERALWRELTEPERSLGVWDGKQYTGTLSAFSFGVSVPGGAVVPAAALTMVGVLPTHRRQGLLTRMMRRHLEDVRAAGREPLAVLTASEPAIYGRFGYGVATWRLLAEIPGRVVTLDLPPGTEGVTLRLVPSEEALPLTEAVYARQVARRPGMPARAPGWEKTETLDPESERDGGSARHCVLAERDGEAVGYARYSVREHTEGPGGTAAFRVSLFSLEADDHAAYAALWRYLLSIDLSTGVTMRRRPVDDPWQYLVSDIRVCRVQVRDDLYLRPVDVGAALAARRYPGGVDTVLEVADPFCPWNEGRWRLSGDASGARCERTADAAELRLSVRELGSAYLGGVGLAALGRAGRVTELRPGALDAVSAAFTAPVAPWLPHGF